MMRRVGKKVERKLGEPIGAALKEIAQRLEFTPRITQGQGSVLGGVSAKRANEARVIGSRFGLQGLVKSGTI